MLQRKYVRAALALGTSLRRCDCAHRCKCFFVHSVLVCAAFRTGSVESSAEMPLSEHAHSIVHQNLGRRVLPCSLVCREVRLFRRDNAIACARTGETPDHVPLCEHETAAYTLADTGTRERASMQSHSLQLLSPGSAGFRTFQAHS